MGAPIGVYSLNPPPKQRFESILSKIKANGLTPRALERQDYPKFGAVAEVRRLVRGPVAPSYSASLNSKCSVVSGRLALPTKLT